LGGHIALAFWLVGAPAAIAVGANEVLCLLGWWELEKVRILLEGNLSWIVHSHKFVPYLFVGACFLTYFTTTYLLGIVCLSSHYRIFRGRSTALDILSAGR
jgi:hypothetical protein